MMRDTMTHHFEDPAVRWASLLQGVSGRRREALIGALRRSIESGYPANAEGVRILVSYAQGQISARQYSAQILESLGFIPPAHTPAPVVRAPEPQPERVVRWPEPRSDALLEFRDSRRAALTVGGRWESDAVERVDTSCRQAVQAFVTGQIPVEEFLRISRVDTP